MTRNKLLYLFSIAILIISGCENKKDDYYARPDWLQGPIYQQLQDEGRFKIFISLLDRMGYDKILGTTGYFTVFAPNDSAFQAAGINSIAQLDSQTIREIVQYSIVKNGYTPNHLAASQSDNGWVEGNSFRRKTRFTNKYYKSDDINDNGNTIEGYIKNAGYKFIPYYLDEFFLTSKISSSDYEKFYPGVPYTGFNVVNARVLGDFIVAENGYIYELDKVIESVQNFDEFFFENPDNNDYSLFADMLKDYMEYEIDTSAHLGLPVYEKNYKTGDNGLVFNLSLEEYIGSLDVQQSNCLTLFAPDNATLQKFMDEQMLKYFTYEELKKERPKVISEFLKSHMYSTAIWPSQFPQKKLLFNVTLDESNVSTYKMLSNGMFYGTKVILNRSNYFNSVLTDIYLNPDYSSYYHAITDIPENESYNTLLSSNTFEYSLFLTVDNVFESTGYSYDDVFKEFLPDAEGASKLLKISVVRGKYTDFSGHGFLISSGGDIIAFGENKLWGGGNLEAGALCAVLSTNDELGNGVVYKLNQNLLPPTKSYVDILATPPTGTSYSKFNEYLVASGLIVNGRISGTLVDRELAILVPTDAAMDAAGLPPSTTTDPAEIEIIKAFILNHILQKSQFPVSGTFKTYNIIGQNGQFNVYSEMITSETVEGFTITDPKGNTVNVINTIGSCNFSADLAGIYQIDSALQY